MKKEDIGIFGKERISKKEKFGKVDAVFETVAERYDLMTVSYTHLTLPTKA